MSSRCIKFRGDLLAKLMHNIYVILVLNESRQVR